jgi:hypothetical protein
MIPALFRDSYRRPGDFPTTHLVVQREEFIKFEKDHHISSQDKNQSFSGRTYHIYFFISKHRHQMVDGDHGLHNHSNP